MENPYAAPDVIAPAIGVVSGRREDLRKVAADQKGILVCIALYLSAVVVQLAAPPALQVVIAIGILIVGLIGTVFVFRLAMQLYSIGLGMLLGILAMVPCLGLLVLLSINAKATKVLKQNGIRVGLLGARLSEV